MPHQFKTPKFANVLNSVRVPHIDVIALDAKRIHPYTILPALVVAKSFERRLNFIIRVIMAAVRWPERAALCRVQS